MISFTIFRYPKVLLLILPVVILLFFIIRFNFTKSPFESQEARKWKKFLRLFVFITRSLIVVLILIAIASPFNIEDKFVNRDPFVRILIDNSSSFKLFDQNIGDELRSQLEKSIGVEVRQLAEGDKSAISDGILQNLRSEENLLLITDGVNNHGSDLGDVILFAKKLNATINAIQLSPIRSDAGVTIEGPTQTMTDVDNTFRVSINEVGDIGPYTVKVYLDDQLIKESTSETEFEFTRNFQRGFHRFSAEVIAENDYFSENNKFYKTVKVVPKPKLLFVSDRSYPLYGFLLDLYDVTTSKNIPDDLDDYYAIVINNIDSTRINNMDGLVDFLTDGNGLVVFGGENSYDLGNYKDSLFESLLPVFVAQPGKKEGDKNIIILIDSSGSFKQQGSISKSIATSIFKDIGKNVKIGAIAFAEKSYLMSPIDYKSNNPDLGTKIARLDVRGDSGTNIAGALYSAINLLSKTSGSKNIIIITDGDPGSSTGGNSAAAAKLAAKQGIKIYPVGIGNDISEGRLGLWASITRGIYFQVHEAKRLKILFGDPEDQKELLQKSVEILDSNHFITETLEQPNAFLSGYNQVVPKTIARLLATTNTGDSLVSVWHYGLGRVAAVSTDDGTFWAGDLLRVINSKLLTRTMNWAIGSPDRKSKDFLNVKDTRIYQPTELSIRTDALPSAEGILFYKADKDLYQAELTPTSTGFQDILGASFASNYPHEFENLGFNDDLADLTSSTGGRMFDKSDLTGIIDHVHSKSKKAISAKVNKRWPFLIAAIILFLVEITVRRIIDHKKIYKGDL